MTNDLDRFISDLQAGESRQPANELETLVTDLHNLAERIDMNSTQDRALRQKFDTPPLKMMSPHKRLSRLAATFAIALAALFATFAIVPETRALMLSVLDLLLPRAATSERTIEYVEFDEDDLLRAETREAAAALASFEVREPQILPQDYVFSSALYLTSRDALQTFFSPQTDARYNVDSLSLRQQPIALAQQLGTFFYTFEPYNIGPEAEIQQVAVGDVMGQYVQGSWTTSPNDPSETYRWDDSFPFHRLIWQVDEMLYEIEWFAGRDAFDLETLIAVAASVTP